MWKYLTLLGLLSAGFVHAAQPADAVRLAYQDIVTLAPEERVTTRYLWVSTPAKEDKFGTFVAVAGHVNGMSLRRRIVTPVLVMADGMAKPWQAMDEKDWPLLTLMRVNIDAYGWDPAIWERLGDPTLEPLFHVSTIVPYPEGKYISGPRKGEKYAAGEEKTTALAPWLLRPLPLHADDPVFAKAIIGLCIESGYSQCPILEADNFVWQSAIQFDRKAGWYDFQGIKDLKTFDALVGFSEKLSLAFRQPLIESVAESGVSVEPRVVEIWDKVGGKYIRTLDQVGQRGIGDRNALDIANAGGSRGNFKFDVFEVYAAGANGFWKTLLADKNGVRQDSAPDGVGYHHGTLTNDGKIHINLTCNGCHDKNPGNGGLKPFAPYFRNKYATPGPLALANLFKNNRDLEDQYLSPIDLTPDQQQYAAAVFQATGQTPDVYAKELLASFHRWDRHLDLTIAAQRYGVTPEVMVESFSKHLKTFGKIDSVNDNWLLVKERRTKVGVNQWAQFYNSGQLMLRGIPTWPNELRKKYPTKPR